MKVLLIDVDSRIPNLALMKLAAWHIDRPRTKRMRQLQRWTARPHLFWSCDIADYDPSIRGHVGMVPEGRRKEA